MHDSRLRPSCCKKYGSKVCKRFDLNGGISILGLSRVLYFTAKGNNGRLIFQVLLSNHKHLIKQSTFQNQNVMRLKTKKISYLYSYRYSPSFTFQGTNSVIWSTHISRQDGRMLNSEQNNRPLHQGARNPTQSPSFAGILRLDSTGLR